MVNDRLNAATSRFAFKLYDQIIKQRPSKNTLVSPASVMLALAMTYNGADGTTREAMARVLELEGLPLEEVNRAFAGLKSVLTPTDPQIQLTIANSLWARNVFVPKPEFVKRNQEYYDAEITSLDFADPAAVQTINAWVNSNTHGLIDKIIEQIKQNEVLFLINAIYFKGQWQFEFDKEKTKPDVFRLPGGAQQEVAMMSRFGDYYYFEGADFQAISLPYGQGSVSMHLFLPGEQSGLDRFERNLTAENWDTWMRSFDFRPGKLMLPRFKVEWEASLNEVLKALGMEVAFDEVLANFLQIADVKPEDNLFISKVKHKARAEVNEEGTEAAAVTSVALAGRGKPPPDPFSMKVDRPFFFAIRDDSTGVLLFMGSVASITDR